MIARSKSPFIQDSDRVPTFGQHMVADHSKANADLKTLADSKKVEVPTESSTVAKRKAKLLEARSGDDFDKAFAKAMVSDHEKAIEAFAKAANKSEDADVKAFAAKNPAHSSRSPQNGPGTSGQGREIIAISWRRRSPDGGSASRQLSRWCANFAIFARMDAHAHGARGKNEGCV